MIALSMLNDWLVPKYLDHWQVQAKLQLLGLPATPEFVYWKQSDDFWRLKILLTDHALVWRSAGTRPDRFWVVGRYADFIVGARWKEGRVIVRSRLQLEIEPFQLKFPYHLPVSMWEHGLYIQGPEDLELLWAFTPPEGLKPWHFDQHRHKMQETFLQLYKNER